MTYRIFATLLSLPLLSTQAFADWKEVFNATTPDTMKDFGQKINNDYLAVKKANISLNGEVHSSIEKCLTFNSPARYIYAASEQFVEASASKKMPSVTVNAWNHWDWSARLFPPQWVKALKKNLIIKEKQGALFLRSDVIDLGESEKQVCLQFEYKDTKHSWIKSLRVFAHP